EDRVDDSAGAAPGGPEVDENGAVGLEHLGLEVGVGHITELAGHCRSPRSCVEDRYSSLVRGLSVTIQNEVSHLRRNRMAGTRQIASATIALLIFDVPSARSLNTIGTSTTLNPALIAR